jgi:hypothetical protein
MAEIAHSAGSGLKRPVPAVDNLFVDEDTEARQAWQLGEQRPHGSGR